LAEIVETISADNGAIAQLGERLLCKQEVAGSIPAGSTTLDAPKHSNDFRTRGALAVSCAL
jgi:hypothetical protein